MDNYVGGTMTELPRSLEVGGACFNKSKESTRSLGGERLLVAEFSHVQRFRIGFECNVFDG